MVASKNGRINVVRYLLEKEAEVDAVTNNGVRVELEFKKIYQYSSLLF